MDSKTEKNCLRMKKKGGGEKKEKGSYLCNEQHMFGLSLEMFFLLIKERKKQVLVCVCILSEAGRLIL